ncbi:MAG: response regulator [Deltaproteobacteria bacterium]|nr:response regulator [Deltaproteobacteria bacterium]
MPVIAAFGGIYCSTDQILRSVSERLGYALVGDRLLEVAAQRFGASPERLARVLSGKRAFFDGWTHESEKNLVYIQAALAEMLGTDDQIFFGPAIHLIPQKISHVLRVVVVSGLEHRVARALAQDGRGGEEAEERIRQSDEDASRWTEKILGRAPWDATLYDIRIPIPPTDLADAVELVSASIASEALKPTDHSIQAVADFQLASRVRLALLERGRYNCEVEADRGQVTVVVHQSDPRGMLARTVQALRFEALEEDVHDIAQEIEGVSAVEVRPGVGFRTPSRTLLVDDERDYVLTLSERLEMRDIVSDVVYDGQQALRYVETDAPDTIVLDLRMPGIDGLEALRRIKEDHPRIEVIVVTGHGSEHDEKLARELGAFEYLNKPVDINELAKLIRAASKKAREAGE